MLRSLRCLLAQNFEILKLIEPFIDTFGYYFLFVSAFGFLSILLKGKTMSEIIQKTGSLYGLPSVVDGVTGPG